MVQISPSMPPLTLGDLTPAEIKLLLFMRHLGHGRVDLKIADGQPVLIIRAEEMIKLV